MHDAILFYLANSIPAVLTGLVAGLAIGLVLVTKAGVQQYMRGREDGYELGRTQGAAAQHRIENAKRIERPAPRRSPRVEAPGTPDIMLHTIRPHGHTGR